MKGSDMERDQGSGEKKRFWRRKRVAEVPEVTGEHPAGAEQGALSGTIFVDNSVNLKTLKDRAGEFLGKHPEIMKGAKKKRQEVVAFVSSHGTGIMIGIGIIAAAGIGAEIFRRTRKRRKK